MVKPRQNRKRKLDETQKFSHFKAINGPLLRRIITKEVKMLSFKYNVASTPLQGTLKISQAGQGDFTALGVRKAKGVGDLRLKTVYEPIDEDHFKPLNGFKLYEVQIKFNGSPENGQLILEYLKKYNILAERVTTPMEDSEYIQKLCEILQPRKLNLPERSDFSESPQYEASYDAKCITFIRAGSWNVDSSFSHFQRLMMEHERVKFRFDLEGAWSSYTLSRNPNIMTGNLELVDSALQEIIRGRQLRLQKFTFVSNTHANQGVVMNVFGKYGIVLQPQVAGPDGAVLIPMNDGRRLLLEFYFKRKGDFRIKMEIV